ncbi:MAG: PilZ domain-containing protein [Hyphomonadaceae bacterium]|nr:PilZ domain-containing protein [Hyphomonadaceae bacterium]
MTKERRAAPRYEVRADGRLLFVDQPCFVECTIRNISEDGALLSMLVSVAVPPVVLLWERRTGAIHECEVRWRNGRSIGVRFIDVWGRAARRAVLEKGFAPLKHGAPGGMSLH